LGVISARNVRAGEMHKVDEAFGQQRENILEDAAL
jgi:hypothetical protein